jgi:pectate lyase
VKTVGLALILSWPVRAGPTAWKWQNERVPDVGFDFDAAQIVRVSSLDGSGAGTLRAALKAKGPRIVVFEVAGVIDLQMRAIDIDESDVVVAGQTAPPPGITLIRGGLRIKASHGVVQHLRVRPGDANQAKGSGWEPDGISTAGSATDVWIDHCSATWSVDENISASGSDDPGSEPARRIGIRHCIIAEGLNRASHHKGQHSKGSLVLDGTQEVAIVENLYSSNVERNPVFKLGTSGVVVNNVIANPGQRAIHATDPANVPAGEASSRPKARIAVVGNVVFFGRETKKSAAIFEGIADGFFKDNEGFDWLGNPLPLLRQPFGTLSEPPVWPDGLKPLTAAATVWHVARFAGARPAQRDTIDQRIVDDALTGAARIIDSQEDVGGYPHQEPVARKLEVPANDRKRWLDTLAEEVEVGSKAAPSH